MSPKRPSNESYQYSARDDMPPEWKGPLPPPPRPEGVQLLPPPGPTPSLPPTKRAGSEEFLSPENVKSRRTKGAPNAPYLQVQHKDARNDDCTISLRRGVEDAGEGNAANSTGDFNKELPPTPPTNNQTRPITAPKEADVLSQSNSGVLDAQTSAAASQSHPGTTDTQTSAGRHQPLLEELDDSVKKLTSLIHPDRTQRQLAPVAEPTIPVPPSNTPNRDVSIVPVQQSKPRSGSHTIGALQAESTSQGIQDQPASSGLSSLQSEQVQLVSPQPAPPHDQNGQSATPQSPPAQNQQTQPTPLKPSPIQNSNGQSAPPHPPSAHNSQDHSVPPRTPSSQNWQGQSAPPHTPSAQHWQGQSAPPHTPSAQNWQGQSAPPHTPSAQHWQGQSAPPHTPSAQHWQGQSTPSHPPSAHNSQDHSAPPHSPSAHNSQDHSVPPHTPSSQNWQGQSAPPQLSFTGNWQSPSAAPHLSSTQNSQGQSVPPQPSLNTQNGASPPQPSPAQNWFGQSTLPQFSFTQNWQGQSASPHPSSAQVWQNQSASSQHSSLQNWGDSSVQPSSTPTWQDPSAPQPLPLQTAPAHNWPGRPAAQSLPAQGWQGSFLSTPASGQPPYDAMLIDSDQASRPPPPPNNTSPYGPPTNSLFDQPSRTSNTPFPPYQGPPFNSQQVTLGPKPLQDASNHSEGGDASRLSVPRSTTTQQFLGSQLPPGDPTAAQKDGRIPEDDYSSNQSDASGRTIGRSSGRRKKGRASVSKGGLSRQGSQPGLAHQFSAPQGPLVQALPHQIGSSLPGADKDARWPPAPNIHVPPQSRKAAEKQPATPQRQQHGPDPTQAGPSSYSIGPTGDSVSSASRTETRSSETALLLRYMEAMNVETNENFKFVKLNMQTRAEGATKAEVESLRDEIAGIRTVQSVMANTNHKRSSEKSRRKGDMMSALNSVASGSRGRGTASEELNGNDSEADPPEQGATKLSSKLRKASANLETPLSKHVNVLRKLVRQHVLKMMGLRDHSALLQVKPLTDEEAQAYSQSLPDAPVVTHRRLRIDFEHPWKKFSYNREVSSVILQDLIRAIKNAMYPHVRVPEELLQSAILEPLLDSHIKTLRQEYRVLKKGEAEEQLREQKRQMGSKRGRKNTLYQSRVITLAKRPALHHILSLMQDMHPCNMSEDEMEEPQHPPLYGVRQAEWQSLELRQCFQTVDELYRADWKVEMHQGNPPRTLFISEHTAAVRPPHGLPRNCYNTKWLHTLKKHERAALCIQQHKKVDLSIPSDIDVQYTPSKKGKRKMRQDQDLMEEDDREEGQEEEEVEEQMAAVEEEEEEEEEEEL